MRLFLLDKTYSGESIYQLKKREIQYLEKVLRLEDGTVFTAKDMNENFYEATILSGGILSLRPTFNPEVTLLDSLCGYDGAFTPIDMYVSVLKGKKNEVVVRALTEIGVSRIIFVQSEFCQEKDFSSHQKERLETILKEAVQQCGGKAPSLEGPISFENAVESSRGRRIILHQALRKSTLSISDAICKKNDINFVISAFVGPEGGFSDNECLFAEERGVLPVLLRTNILRAETCSVYTAAAIQTLMH